MQKTAMHPQDGVPIVFHDQLNIIAQRLTNIKQFISEKNAQHQAYLKHILPTVNAMKSTKKKQKLTRKILKQLQDWSDWLASEHKQLNQCEAQCIFSEPTLIPDNTNCLPYI